MKQTDTILDKIVASQQAALSVVKHERPLKELERELEVLHTLKDSNFYAVLKAEQPEHKIIAEIKQASPSAGTLRPTFDLAAINEAYQAAANIVAISVITEPEHFQGSEESLEFVARHNDHDKPLLRKDFIFDPYQVLESKLLGAQAFLLIASLFDGGELSSLVDLGLSIGLEPLVEVHTQQELAMVLTTKARCIGVNARNLHDFSTDVATHELLRQLDNSYVKVAESAIDSADYLSYLSTFTDAALIGSHFMKTDDISVAINSLINPKNRGQQP